MKYSTPGDPFTKDKNNDRWLKILDSGMSVDYRYMPFDLIGATPGNPETIEIPEFRYIKITESGYGVDYSYAPYSDLGDSCLFRKLDFLLF